MVTSARVLYWPHASFVWLMTPFLLHRLLFPLLGHPNPLLPEAASLLLPQKIR